MSRRAKIEHTEDWRQVEPLCIWPEQVEYERMRSVVVFGDPVAERSRQTGTPETTLRRKIVGFENEGMLALFPKEQVREPALDPQIRRLIVDLKAQHPPMGLGEISQICYVQFDHKPSKNTIKAVLRDEAAPLFPSRHYPPYREIPLGRERRLAVVRLHAEGWTPTAIASYLETSRQTVYEVLKRWAEEGPAGLEDKPRGRPKGADKVNLRAMNEVRKLQQNPELGAFRVSAALEQVGIYLSARTCGRILAVNRQLYGLTKPKRGPREKKEMPFASNRRHEIWTVDIRHIDHTLTEEDKLYCISVLENHSRALLASSVSRNKDLMAYLSVLYAAVQQYGAPEVLVTDSEGLFKANQAQAIYSSLGITKKEIEKGQPWQSYIESAFSVQQRLVDHHFRKAQSFEEIVAAHDQFVANYNTQKHFAHEDRTDGRRSPAEVLGWLTTVRHLPEELERAFFSVRFTRTLDASGYARIRHWRVYCEQGLARCEVALWLGNENLVVEYAGDTLSRYEVRHSSGSKELREVTNPVLFETSHQRRWPQLQLFALDEACWLKALRLEGYAPRTTRDPHTFQRTLSAYEEVL